MDYSPGIDRIRALRRRARGINGMAAAWALVWMPLWIATGLAAGVVDAIIRKRPDILILGPLVGLTIGFVGGWLFGLSFGALLWCFERDRSLQSLPVLRVALWGALPGVIAGGILFHNSILLGILGVLGAGTAYMMLRIAQRDLTAASALTSSNALPIR